MMITRLERLEAAQDRMEAAILERQQQSQPRDHFYGQRRRSLGACYVRVHSTLVGAKGYLLRRTRSRLATCGHQADAYLLLFTSKLLRLSAWLVEIDTRLHPGRAAQAAQYRLEADWGDDAARCILECLKDGGNIGSVWHEILESSKDFPSHKEIMSWSR